MSKKTLSLGMLIAAGAWVAACSKSEPKPEANPAPTTAAPEEKKAVTIDRAMLVQFDKLPKVFDAKSNPLTAEKILLGKQLYFDKRLSKGQDRSCNSCHGLDTYGVDNKKTSPGHRSQLGARNSPTVLNAAGQFVQFWDGRAADVEAQALGPLTNPVEMAMTNDKSVLAVINSMPDYVAAFKKAFPADVQPVNFVNLGKAIGAFERTLNTPAPIDQYLSGDDSALSEQQKAGLAKFMDVGCTTCHSGNLFGGTTYQKLGLAVPWPDQKDLGRFDQTKAEVDKMMFKTPQLRNVAKTAPYYHDGSIATLSEAVKLMAKHQLGKTLSDEDTANIVAFLESLTGTPQPDWAKEPELPKSTAKTPKPDLK